jgi:hypothetical protein
VAIGWRRRGDGTINGSALATRRNRARQAPAGEGRFACHERMGCTELVLECPVEETAEDRGAASDGCGRDIATCDPLFECSERELVQWGVRVAAAALNS